MKILEDLIKLKATKQRAITDLEYDIKYTTKQAQAYYNPKSKYEKWMSHQKKKLSNWEIKSPNNKINLRRLKLLTYIVLQALGSYIFYSLIFVDITRHTPPLLIIILMSLLLVPFICGVTYILVWVLYTLIDEEIIPFLFGSRKERIEVSMEPNKNKIKILKSEIFEIEKLIYNIK